MRHILSCFLKVPLKALNLRQWKFDNSLYLKKILISKAVKTETSLNIENPLLTQK